MEGVIRDSLGVGGECICPYTYISYSRFIVFMYIRIDLYTDTGIPHFSKVRFTLLHFYKRPTLVPVSLTKRDPKIFTFMKKDRKWKRRRCLFCSEHYRGSVTWAVRTAPSSSFSGTTVGIPASAARAVNCVCEHLCFIAMRFVLLWARQALK